MHLDRVFSGVGVGFASWSCFPESFPICILIVVSERRDRVCIFIVFSRVFGSGLHLGCVFPTVSLEFAC